MADKFEIIFVINGQEYPFDVNPNQAIKAGMVKALKDAGIKSPEGWEIRTEAGEKLNTSDSFKDQGIIKPTKLFLSKGAGRGGR